MTPSLHCSIITLLTAFFLIGSMALGIEAPPEGDPTQKKRGPVFSGGIRWRN